MRRLVRLGLGRLLARLLQGYYRFVLATSRTITIGEAAPHDLRRRGRPRIYAVWHCCVFFGPALGAVEAGPVWALVSARGRGTVLDDVIRALGHRTVRGSSSRRGAKAYRQMHRVLSRGRAIAFSPDGPAGPAYTLKAGLVRLARRSGATIIPAHFESSRQWVRSTWDEQRIPLPFGRLVVCFGEPIEASEWSPEQAEDDFRRFVELRLRENRDNCRRVAGELAG